MQLNILRLHCTKDDKNLRQCLRAYGVLPKYCKASYYKTEQATEITRILKGINERLRKQIGIGWKNKWKDAIGYRVSKSALKDWVSGRASIPLIAISALNQLGCEKEVQQIIEKIRYVSSTTREIVRIPNSLTPDILYLSGLILGDGSLPIQKGNHEDNREYCLSITSKDRIFLENEIKPLIEKTFEIQCSNARYYNHGGPTWTLAKANKTIYRFFTEVVGIPNGNKSKKGKIPQIIKELNPRETIPFLAGLIDSDIGKHGHGMGCTFKSKELVNDLIEHLEKLDICAKHYGSHFKNNKYIQHDFTIPKSQIKRLKGHLYKSYLPKRKDRLELVDNLAHGYSSGRRGVVQGHVA